MKLSFSFHLSNRGSQITADLVVIIVLLLVHSNIEAQIYIGDLNERNIQMYNKQTGALITKSLTTSGVFEPFSAALSGNILYVSDQSTDNSAGVGKYNATTGAVISRFFIDGLTFTEAIAITGNTLYVVNYPNGHATVSTYNANTGAVVKANFITTTGSQARIDNLAILGNDLYMVEADQFSGIPKIGEYNATTGAVINDDLVTGISSNQIGIAVSGNNLYVPNANEGSVSLYNATTGALINGTFTSGLADPYVLAVNNNILYEVDDIFLTVSEWDATTGAPINTSFITGLDSPLCIAVVPEPSTWVALIFGIAPILFWGHRQSRALKL